ncbi:MAG: amino acid/amide transporter substrate-binding protein family [Betaproteobacteria bacterium]|nr:amino acid/amide transporter substrate-binding protein family [Betaproteobacteria bacterium]
MLLQRTRASVAFFNALFATIVSALTTVATPVAAQEVLVGQVGSQTNIVTGANGRGINIGINAYFASVNAAGGVNGKKLKLVFKEDDGNGPKMVAASRELAANKDLVAFAGFVNTSGLTEMAKKNTFAELGVPLVAPLQGDKTIVSADGIFPFRSGYPDETTALIKEAVSTQKKRVVVAYFSATFGPSMEKLAQDEAKKAGLPVVASIKIDAAPEKFKENMAAASAEVIKANPDAVIMLMSSRFAAEMVRAVKNSPAASAQMYAMSVVWADEIVKAAGAEKARGTVIIQAIPFPYSVTLPVVGEYQRVMKQYAPSEQINFPTFEGFIAGKITVEAIKRAGPNPTREKVLKALLAMGEYNLGGVYVNYGPAARKGWGGTDPSVIGPNGKLLH